MTKKYISLIFLILSSQLPANLLFSIEPLRLENLETGQRIRLKVTNNDKSSTQIMGNLKITWFDSDEEKNEEEFKSDEEESKTKGDSDIPKIEKEEFIDSDGDGLPDVYELNYRGKIYDFRRLDPYDVDSDDDGLSDYDEVTRYGLWRKGVIDEENLCLVAQKFWENDLRLDPLFADTDQDGIPDGVEVGVTEPIPDGDFVTTPDGEEVQIKGTDLDARFMFHILLKNVPGYEGDDPYRKITQFRHSYRADADPGFGIGSYYTHPDRGDSNHNGYVDGLEDYQYSDSTIEKLTDKNYYNAPSNYNGAFDEGELDAMTGIYEGSIDWEYHTGLFADGGFSMSVYEENPKMPELYKRTGEVYYIIGPSVPDTITFDFSDPLVSVEPSLVENLQLGQRIRLKVSDHNNSGESSILKWDINWIDSDEEKNEEEFKSDEEESKTKGDSDIPKIEKEEFIDSDGDGLSDVIELRITSTERGTKRILDIYDKDTDDDGLSDYEELTYYGFWKEDIEKENHLCLNAQYFWGNEIKLDPLNPDSDRDGIPDGTEIGVNQPVSGGPMITKPNGEQIQIKGTDTEARYDFYFRLGVVPGYEGSEPHKFIKQERYCFRIDEDPKLGIGSYYTHPAWRDSDHDGYPDGLEDYQTSNLSVEKLEDENFYNALSNYNGAYDEGELDAMTGIYEGNERWQNHIKLLNDGGFSISAFEEVPEMPDLYQPAVEVYYIIGPDAPGTSVLFGTNNQYVTVEPSKVDNIQLGQRIRLRVKNHDQSGKSTLFKWNIEWIDSESETTADVVPPSQPEF